MICKHCSNPFEPNPRSRRQQVFCCPQCARTHWRSEQRKNDPNWRDIESACHKIWRDKNRERLRAKRRAYYLATRKSKKPYRPHEQLDQAAYTTLMPPV